MKACLDLHDFSIVNSRLDMLLALKKAYPKIKVSLFTVPYDEIQDWGISLIRKDLLEQVKTCLDWIQIIPHGFTHSRSEAIGLDELGFKNMLSKIQRQFAQDGLPFEKGFCAPHWRWNSMVVRVLDELGWWGAVWKNESFPYPKRFYQADYCIDHFPIDREVLKLHGHVYGTRNDIGSCFSKLLKLPKDTEWHFVTDFLEDKGN